MPTNLELCLSFSRLLSYPNAQVKMAAADCYKQLKQCDPQAAMAFANFINFLEQQELPQIEELYTSAFDLQAISFPYIGYQLCGESQARTMFLMKLQEIYNQHNFSSEGELPDHLSVMLRFIGTVPDPQGNSEIISDALLPALEKIIQGIENQAHPYRQLLVSLQTYLTNLVAIELPESAPQKELSHG
ncbi:nitrate reductase molybdenum cofactor assembly chaperone [Geopsychrobacter electrodiphilus]|uniref:nitrate reductase molybdenum cofactor assembly chaperone n=1 Tax=Geopsychrobacter electrodiphilus TaxID=225196 RepID=UPI000373470B|nr:nitrate reductase molybdenum cofactor assembly chaperone [Geopsychrobacter electrodiphilus]